MVLSVSDMEISDVGISPTMISTSMPPGVTTTAPSITSVQGTKDNISREDDFVPFDLGTPVSRGQTHKRKREADTNTNLQEGLYKDPPLMIPNRYSMAQRAQEMLTKEVMDVVGYLQPTAEEHQTRQYVLQIVRRAIQDLWSDATAEIFGSFDTQLYLPTSDLDIVVKRSYQPISKVHMRILAKTLGVKNIGVEIQVISQAKVPLIKFRERITGIPCDISFNIDNGLSSGIITKQFLREWPILRPLVMLVKYFLMLKMINDPSTGGLGSYTTTLLCLNFLQMHPLIQMGVIDPFRNLGMLLLEFFELYGCCFNYADIGIRVTEGGSYAVRADMRTVKGKPDPHKIYCVDPNNSANNTARATYRLNLIQSSFKIAKVTMVHNLHSKISEIHGVAVGAHHRHQQECTTGGCNMDGKDQTYMYVGSVGPYALSPSSSTCGLGFPEMRLLKGVLMLPVKVITFRAKIEETFYSGVLQDMFGHPRDIRPSQQLGHSTAVSGYLWGPETIRSEPTTIIPATALSTANVATTITPTSAPLSANTISQTSSIWRKLAQATPNVQATPENTPPPQIKAESPKPTSLVERVDNNPWLTEDEDAALVMDADANAPIHQTCKKLRLIVSKMDLVNSSNDRDLIQAARRKVIRMATLARIRATESQQKRKLGRSEKSKIYAGMSSLVYQELGNCLDVLETAGNHSSNHENKTTRAASETKNKRQKKNNATATKVTPAHAQNNNEFSPQKPPQPRTTLSNTMTWKSDTGRNDVEYVILDSDSDSDKEQDASDKFFDDLMAQGAKEYDTTDDEKAVKLKDGTKSKGRHNNPCNVDTSGRSIMLPQLL
ncbi:hypothetical protein BG004_001113 [Podila humilis]|nr:hypothetical protein BG004_001113 [Podila humilis]